MSTAPMLEDSPFYTLSESPIGDLLLLGDGEQLRALYMNDAGDYAKHLAGRERADAKFASVTGQLAEYFAGERQTFDLALAPRGSEFQKSVWRALLEIPYGETRSYGQIAASVGKPHAARAIGTANNRNPISVIVPCHRVIGANGSLVGYGGGLGRKEWLLGHERGAAPLMAAV